MPARWARGCKGSSKTHETVRLWRARRAADATWRIEGGEGLETVLANGGIGEERVVYRRLLWAGPLAGLSAAAANAVVYLAASAAGAMPRIDVSGLTGQGPITLGAVALESFAPALVAAALFALFGRFTRRPVRNFRALATVLLALSFVGPLNLPKVPAAMIASLLIMHVVAAVLIVGVLTTLARKDRASVPQTADLRKGVEPTDE